MRFADIALLFPDINAGQGVSAVNVGPEFTRNHPGRAKMSTEQHADASEIYMTHDMFRREFSLLPGLIRRVGDGDVERAGVIANHFALIHGVLYHHHHGEDTHIWPLLRARGGAGAEALAQAMERQHEEMDAVLAEIIAGLADWRETAGREQGVAIADAAEQLRHLLIVHLAAEEERALPLIERHVTAAEFDKAVQAEVAEVAPDQMILLLGMTLYEASPEATRKVTGNMPPEVRPVITNGLAAEAFARYCELVHGTPTPAKIGALR
jgi:iron-sulfur cluster repair protein YtfE (RIC family)